jgi:chorismate mutase/prephenate dehydratase
MPDQPPASDKPEQAAQGLGGIRVQIDAIDEQLIRLLNQRADLVMEVAEVKKKAGLDIYVPGREEALLRKLCQINTAQHGKLTEKAIRSIFREIMSAALALEDSLKIAYLGPAGSWTHQVAVHKFGNSVEYIAEAAIEGAFARVASREVDYAVLPIEHSTEGAVHHTLDHLVDAQLQIYAEILWKVETIVMAQDDETPPNVIYGHPQMLAPCRTWLAQRFPGAKLIESASSSLAATHAETEAGVAALGTPLGAELHELKVIAASPSEVSSRARFIILGRRSGDPSGNDNTMLMVHASDRVGALLEVLKVFATRNVNVRQIENRPVLDDPTGTQARFFLEISGHHEDATLKEVISELTQLGSTVKVLGSYPAPRWVEER